MLTGRQIHMGCRLVGMTTSNLARCTKVAYVTLLAVKDCDATPGIDFLGMREIRVLLESRGAEFFINEDGKPDARLRPREKPGRAPRT